MKELLLLALGGIISGVGMLALRRLRKDFVSEEILRKTQMLDLRERMVRQGVTVQELHELQSSLMREVRQKEDALISELERADADDPTANMTQDEMNQYAWRRAAEMDAKLETVIAELQGRLDEKEQQRFAEVQQAWRAYRDSQAELASMSFEGGSMQPTIRYGTQLHLTIERIAMVQSEYDLRSGA